MKLSSLWRILIIIIIIIIIGGIIIIIVVGRGPLPPEPDDRFIGLNGVRYLGIAEVVLGIISLGLINKIRNIQKF